MELIKEIVLSEPVIRDLILEGWSNDEDITGFGVILNRNDIRTQDIFLISGKNIKIKEITFKYTEDGEGEFLR